MIPALALYKASATPISTGTYSANPYVALSLTNPFLSMPDEEKSAEAIIKGHKFKYYIPKIEDLLEVVMASKLHIFRGMIASRLFDLKRASLKGETLISCLEKKGKEKTPFTMILANCGVDLESLAPVEFWEDGLTADEKSTVLSSFAKTSAAKRAEEAVMASLTHLKKNTSSNTRREVLRRITAHSPHMDTAKILDVAMTSHHLASVVEHAVKKGANPNTSRNAITFISEIARNPETSPRFLSAARPARFPVTTFDVSTALLPDGLSSAKLHKASVHGFQEHFFRSQLCALYGLNHWVRTLDQLSRPQPSLYGADIHHFFEAIQKVVGYPSSPIILTENNTPISESDWDAIMSDPARPIVFATGWSEHAAVAVIVKDKLYKGNRGESSEEMSPGIYCTTIDRSQLTSEICDEIVSNSDSDWYEYTLDCELGGKPAKLHSPLKAQYHPNCSWSSCAELSFYILHRDLGKTHEQAWLLVKQMKAKVRHSFLLSYLSHDRTHEPHLHSAPLLGAILAKSLVRESADFPEYSMSIEAILKSGLSIDMLQLIHTLERKTKDKNSVKNALAKLAKRLDLSTEKMFERLDPVYREEESRYKTIIKAQDDQSSHLPLFPSSFNVMYLLNEKTIPESYKLAIIDQLIPPLFALILLASDESKSFSPSVKLALSAVAEKAGVSSPNDFLEFYKWKLQITEYKDTAQINSLVRSVLSREAFLSSKPLTDKTEKEINQLHEFIALLLCDPIAGFELTTVLLETATMPLRIKNICNKKEVFPDGAFLRNKKAFKDKITSLISQPGWDSASKMRVFMQFIASEPFKQQITHLKIFLKAIEEAKPEDLVVLTDSLIAGIWRENPILIHQVFSIFLKSSKKDLYLSHVFSRLTHFLWKNDAEFMKPRLKDDIQNVALWSKEIRDAVREEFPPGATLSRSKLPDAYVDSLLAEPLLRGDGSELVFFLTKKVVFPFNKRRRDRTDEVFSMSKKSHYDS